MRYKGCTLIFSRAQLCGRGFSYNIIEPFPWSCAELNGLDTQQLIPPQAGGALVHSRSGSDHIVSVPDHENSLHLPAVAVVVTESDQPDSSENLDELAAQLVERVLRKVAIEMSVEPGGSGREVSGRSVLCLVYALILVHRATSFLRPQSPPLA